MVKLFPVGFICLILMPLPYIWFANRMDARWDMLIHEVQNGTTQYYQNQERGWDQIGEMVRNPSYKPALDELEANTAELRKNVEELKETLNKE